MIDTINKICDKKCETERARKALDGCWKLMNIQKSKLH